MIGLFSLVCSYSKTLLKLLILLIVFIVIDLYSLTLLKTYVHGRSSSEFLNLFLHMLFSCSFGMVSSLIIETYSGICG